MTTIAIAITTHDMTTIPKIEETSQRQSRAGLPLLLSCLASRPNQATWIRLPSPPSPTKLNPHYCWLSFVHSTAKNVNKNYHTAKYRSSHPMK